MKARPWLAAEPYRLSPSPLYASRYGDDYGFFEIPGPCGAKLRCIVSNAVPTEGVFWEHVSVSLKNRCPNWREMCFIKDIFWGDDETVMQLHPPKNDYVDCHPYCLHMWRPMLQEIPMPPSIMVGPNSAKKGAA